MSQLLNLPAFLRIQERAKQHAQKQEKLISKPVSGSPDLPHWPATAMPAPNCFLRTSLFGVFPERARKFVHNEAVSAPAGIEIRFTGEQLNQDDLDFFIRLVQLTRLSEKKSISEYALLRLQEITDSKSNRTATRLKIDRLAKATIQIDFEGGHFVGSLLSEAFREKNIKKWFLTLNPTIVCLFSPSTFSLLDWGIREELRGKQLALWLFGFFFSHREPFPVKIETIRRLCGSSSEIPRFRQSLRTALEQVAIACKKHGQKFSFSISGDLVSVRRSVRPPKREAA